MSNEHNALWRRVSDHAASLGLMIEEDHSMLDGEVLPGFWIIDPMTGEGPWADENFSTSLEEVAGKLVALEIERNAE